jgi:hypothetical protein
MKCQTRSRGFWLCIAAAVAVAVIAVPAASAGVGKHKTVELDSKVTFARKAPWLSPVTMKMHGRVESRRHACEVHRKVEVFVQRPGPDKLHATERSNQRGKWVHTHGTNTAGLGVGNFYARVVREERTTAGTTFVCGGNRSPAHPFEL